MKDFKDIVKQAKKDAQVGEYLKNNNSSYNTYYTFSHNLVQALAIKTLSEKLKIEPEIISQQYYIDGASLSYPTEVEVEITKEDGKVVYTTEKKYISIEKSLSYNDFKTYYGKQIKALIENTKKNATPSFLTIDGDNHFILIALVPKLGNSNEFNFVYMNSIEKSSEGCGATGREFFELLKFYIVSNKEKFGTETNYEDFLDLSVEQQIDNCCGLSVASNIASIASHHAQEKYIINLKENLFILQGSNKDELSADKRKYYSKLGIELYEFIGLGENINKAQGSNENSWIENIASWIMAFSLSVLYLVSRIYEVTIAKKVSSELVIQPNINKDLKAEKIENLLEPNVKFKHVEELKTEQGNSTSKGMQR
ncbi:MAG: hypothetical protein ACK4OM_01585 [Alphaproteobacteria bacterium]